MSSSSEVSLFNLKSGAFCERNDRADDSEALPVGLGILPKMACGVPVFRFQLTAKGSLLRAVNAFQCPSTSGAGVPSACRCSLLSALRLLVDGVDEFS